MKIVVVYGEDEAKARERYSQIISAVKKKNWQVADVSTVGKFSLPERISSMTLFGDNTLFTLDSVKKLTPTEIKWLAKNFDKYEGSLLIFQKGTLPADIKKEFPKSTTYEQFEVPKIIFIFLESFYPGNAQTCLKLLDKFLNEAAPEAVVATLGRHLRDLYWVRVGGLELPAWRLGKLKNQSQKFTKEILEDTINALSDIDIGSKTSSVNTRFLLELLIIEKLG